MRVSTVSQDESSQVKAISRECEERGITIVKWFKLHGYSASKGEQEPALREAIADMERGDYPLLIVTESRSLDRREDLDAQAEILLDIRRAGGDVLSISEPQYGKTDFAGRVVTLVQLNAEKSKVVKDTDLSRDSDGPRQQGSARQVPMFWEVARRPVREAGILRQPGCRGGYLRAGRERRVAAVDRPERTGRTTVRRSTRRPSPGW